MLQVGLFDSSFVTQPSMGSGNSLSSANRGEYLPSYFQWDRDQFHKTNFYTDMRLYDVLKAPSGTINIALLIEPPENSLTHYVIATQLENKFDHILTYVRSYSSYGKYKFYPFGMTYIGQEGWKIYPKTKFCSMIYSHKVRMQGHALRHGIASAVKNYPVDLYGTGSSTPVTSKLTALAPYQFSIVVENCSIDWWFTEKLIDCFATRTVPIYWGCPDLNSFFNYAGVLRFTTIEELLSVIDWLSRNINVYNNMLKVVEENAQLAMRYTIPEDWIYTHYPYMFPPEE